MRFNIYNFIFFIINLSVDFSLFSNNAYINSVAIDKDNKIVAGGFYYSGDHYNYGDTKNFAIAKYNQDGTLDTTFNPTGGQPGIVTTVVTIAPTPEVNDIDQSNSEINALAIDSKNRIVVAGYLKRNVGLKTSTIYTDNNYFVVARYNPDGTLDKTFNSTGAVSGKPGIVITNIDYNNNLTSLVIDSNDNIIAAGYLTQSIDTGAGVPVLIAIVKYLENGDLDKNFNSTGAVSGKPGIVVTNISADYLTSQSGLINTANAVTLDSKERIVITGEATTSTYIGVLVARYNKDGTLDKTFNKTGSVITPIISYHNGYAIGYGVKTSLIDNQEKIIVAGSAQVRGFNGNTTDVIVIRYNEDGSLDKSFKGPELPFVKTPAGIVATTISTISSYATSLVIDDTDLNNIKTVVAGYAYYTLEPTLTITTDIDFSLLAAFLTIRYNQDGSLDKTFNSKLTPGYNITNIDNGAFKSGLQNYATATSLALDLDNNIILAGGALNDFYTNDFALAKYTPDGILDKSFNKTGTPNGTLVTSIDNGIDFYKYIFMGATVAQNPFLTSTEITPQELAEVSGEFSVFKSPKILSAKNKLKSNSKFLEIKGVAHPDSKVNLNIKDSNNNIVKNITLKSDKLGRWATEVKDLNPGNYYIVATSKDPISFLKFKSNKVKINIEENIEEKSDIAKNKNKATNKLEANKLNSSKIFKINKNPVNILINSDKDLKNSDIKNNIKEDLNLKRHQEILKNNKKTYYISHGNSKEPYIISSKKSD